VFAEVRARVSYLVAKVVYWADYIFPREIFGTFAVVFAFENAIDIALSRWLGGLEIIGWVTFGVAVAVATSIASYLDDDKSELEGRLKSKEKEIEDKTGVDVGPRNE